MSAPKGHVYGFNIKSASGSSAPATGGSAPKPAIIVDKFQQTAVPSSPPSFLSPA
jgi:hypothetical protein